MNKILKFALWLFVSTIFTADLMKIVLDLSLVSGSVHQRFLTHFFRSSFFLFELIMGGMIVYFSVKHHERRWRLLSVSVFHYLSVLILPLATRDFTWMAVLYPWPMTLLAFDPKTTIFVSTLSIIVGFVLLPAVTLVWGAKGFCGYVCPHGGFYSEAYGRLFSAPRYRLPRLRRYFPPLYFLAMTVALVAILARPDALEPVRKIQKLAFFLTSQLFYMVFAIPLVGARSYCTHFCPIGFEVKHLLWVRRSAQARR